MIERVRACSGARVDVEQGVEQGADRQQQEQNGERQRDIAEEIHRGFAQLRHQVQAELDHQRRRHLRQPLKHLVVAEVVDPVQRRLAAEHAAGVQDQVTRHPSEHQRDDQQHQQRQSRLQKWVLFERAPEALGFEPELFDIHKRNVSSVRREGRLEHLRRCVLQRVTNRATKNH